jgi:membrane protein
MAAIAPRGAVRRTARALVRSFDEHDLMTYASAIAFRGIFALIPLTLVALGLLGLFSLDGTWAHHMAPDVRGAVSRQVYEVLDTTVRRVLGAQQLFWATAGALLAVWDVSGAVRGTMSVLDGVHHVDRERSRFERYGVSLVLSAVVTVLLLLAFGVFVLGGTLASSALGAGGLASAVSLLRWPLTVALLLAVVATVVRWGPAEQRPWRWVSFGTALVVGGWLAMSVAFGWYLRNVADYGSVFGNLATVIVAFEYAYLSAIVFMAGLALDGLAQR